jgi:ribosomal-protein-alanine N-acetyltransferase
MALERFIELESECQGAEAWSADLVRDGLENAAWLLDAAGRGYAVVSVTGDFADLQRIGVSPSFRRLGVASSLLSQAITVARNGGADRLLLEVSQANAGALALYAAHGFVEIDRRPRYYKDGTDAVVMQLNLGSES